MFLFITSGLINILALTGSFYMLQIYDRALASGSVPTLLGLSFLAIGLYMFQGLFDIIRSLQFMSMTILADEHGGADPFAVLEYALDPDATDDVLLVNLGSDGDVLSVTSAD